MLELAPVWVWLGSALKPTDPRPAGGTKLVRRLHLEHLLLKGEVRHKAAQAGVLALQILQPLGWLELKPAVLLAPAVITLLGDPGLLGGERQALALSLALSQMHPNLAQLGDDLLCAEPLPFGHLRLLCSGPILSINPVQIEPVRSIARV